MHDDSDGGAAATRVLRRSLALIAAVTIVTAWFSDLYYFPDEHYQVLEFMSLKLGITAPADMRWEYFAHIRPWMQPFLYYLIAKPLLLLGLKDLFLITFLLRLATGFLSVAALALFAKELLPGIAGREEKLAFAGYLPLFGFLPYLFVRTSSETISAAFFTLGLALVIRDRSMGRVFWAAVLSGLAFDCRYQSAILIVGLIAWLIIVARLPQERDPEKCAAVFRKIARPNNNLEQNREKPDFALRSIVTFAGGLLLSIMAGVAVDRWGYGVWSFTPWLYFKANILEGVAAREFGTQPVFAYFYLLPAQFFAVITVVLMVAMIVMWLRNPRHIVTWVTLPFVLIHMGLGHKEARFLFPLAILATAFPVLGFSPQLPRWQKLAAQVWGWRKSPAAKSTTGISVAAMALLAVYPFGFRPHMPMAKYVYRHFASGLVAYTFDHDQYPFVSYPMYRPAGSRFESLQTAAELRGLLQKGPVYLLADRPTLPANVLPAGAHATMLYSEFPFAGLGYDVAATRYLNDFAGFSAWAGFLKMPPLAWVTLYRIERAATTRR